MSEIKKKVEALLFSSGRRMSIEELGNLLMVEQDALKPALEELRKDYAENENTALTVVNDGIYWKLTNKPSFLELIKKIVSKTELSKTLMETLAVIAFKYPIKQADLIRIRSNKAYDHLRELEELGYISRQKHGRSKLIKLTDKFFEYFDLKEDNLKDQFRDFESIAKTIEDKEEDIRKIREEHRKRLKEEAKKKKEIEENDKEVDLIDNEGNEVELDVVNVSEIQQEEKPKESEAHTEVVKDEVNGMNVYDVPKKPVAEEEQIDQEEYVDEVEEGTEAVAEVKAPEEKIDDKVSHVFGYYNKEVTGKEEVGPEPEEQVEETPEKETEQDQAQESLEQSKEESSEEVKEEVQEEPSEEIQEPKKEENPDDRIPIKDQPGAKDLLEADSESIDKEEE
jgi:segregation and condensation protein B